MTIILHNHTTRRPAGADDSLTRQLGRDASVPQVFEFTNGPDEPAPPLWLVGLPALPVLIGHASDYHGDPDGPILTDGQMHRPGCVPAQVCSACDVEVVVAIDPAFTFLIADHRPGCPRYAELAERLAS